MASFSGYTSAERCRKRSGVSGESLALGMVEVLIIFSGLLCRRGCCDRADEVVDCLLQRPIRRRLIRAGVVDPRGRRAQANALMPVRSRPMSRAWILSVPSYVC